MHSTISIHNRIVVYPSSAGVSKSYVPALKWNQNPYDIYVQWVLSTNRPIVALNACAAVDSSGSLFGVVAANADKAVSLLRPALTLYYAMLKEVF